MTDELLTVSETAKYMKLSEKTIRRLIKDERLTASKAGSRTWRIKTSDVEEYIRANLNGKKGAKRE